jgi:GNAT superfamily N-acetyltransferase
MLDYSLGKKIKIRQKETKDLYLFKTEPFLDVLYNYAYTLNGKITKRGISTIKNFFKDEPFRIKVPETKNNSRLLLASGFKFKDDGYIMKTGLITRKNYSSRLPKNITILPVDNLFSLKQARQIFCEAFAFSLKEYKKKFSFLHEIMIDKNNPRIKVFILYENGQPVSTGAYYAFDKFSIENIGTIKSARGRGYAGLIMKRLLTEAKMLGYKQACLVASEAGSHVYKKVGFKILAKTNTYI